MAKQSGLGWQSTGQGFESPQLHSCGDFGPQRTLAGQARCEAFCRSSGDRLFMACALILEQNWSTTCVGTKYCQRSAPVVVSRSAQLGASAASWTSRRRLIPAAGNPVVKVGDRQQAVHGLVAGADVKHCGASLPPDRRRSPDEYEAVWHAEHVVLDDHPAADVAGADPAPAR